MHPPVTHAALTAPFPGSLRALGPPLAPFTVPLHPFGMNGGQSGAQLVKRERPVPIGVAGLHDRLGVTLETRIARRLDPCLDIGGEFLARQRAVAVGIGGLEIELGHHPVPTGPVRGGKGRRGGKDERGGQNEKSHGLLQTRGRGRAAGRGFYTSLTQPQVVSVARLTKCGKPPALDLAGRIPKFGSFWKGAPHMSHSPPLPDDRPMVPALLHGWQRRCPCCGDGALMGGFLRVRDACADCGEAFHHHRADDGPAYLTVLIVAKLAMAFYMAVFLAFAFEPWVMIVLTWGASLAMVFYLLPRFKGAIVALQWSRRMHGFDGPATPGHGSGHGR